MAVAAVSRRPNTSRTVVLAESTTLALTEKRGLFPPGSRIGRAPLDHGSALRWSKCQTVFTLIMQRSRAADRYLPSHAERRSKATSLPGVSYCTVKLHTCNVPPGVALTRLPQ